MKTLFLGALLMVAPTAFAKTMKFVGDGQGQATVRSKTAVQKTKAELSMALSSPLQDLGGGKIKMKDLNLMIKGVDQSKLIGKRLRGKTRGALGINLQAQKLEYDKNSKVIAGELKGKVDYPYLGTLVKDINPKADLVQIPTQDVLAQLKLVLGEELIIPVDKCGPFQLVSYAQIQMQALPLPEFGIPGWTVDLLVPHIEIIYTCSLKMEFVKELCVQPVSIVDGPGDSDPTGDGLAFGMPGASVEWAKAGVVFKVRALKTRTSASLKTMSQTETTAMRNLVQDDDCIEVFFAEQFSPNALFGGGVTFGLGVASSQVISSDENADFNIDFTHLAHELGHVMALHHPNQGFPTAASPTIFDGSTGTLMCPSGFQNDNPAINSEENSDNIHNPLFKFKLKRALRAFPDCDNGSDCGSC